LLIDSHCHLGDPAFDPDRPLVLARAWEAGLGAVILIGESRGAAERALALAEADPRLWVTAGVHPHTAADWSHQTEQWLRLALANRRVVAAGEMGLDYHYDNSPREVQREVFGRQLELAREAGKPAVVHAREADDDVGAILAEHPGATAILHSFSSGMGLLRQAVAAGHYVSFSGMITFKSWRLDEAIQETPLDRLLIETDAPYLAPVPHRGHRNEPAFVAQVAERIAVVRGMTPAEVAAATGANAVRVFGLQG